MEIIVWNGKRRYLEKVKAIINLVIRSHVFKLMVLLLLCVYLMVVSLKFSVGELGDIMYASYFENGWILLLNYLPIAFVTLVVYVLTTKTSISFAMSAFLSFGITMINYVKMYIRNDNFLIGDIFLIREAATTKFDYPIIFNRVILKYVLFFALICVILYVVFDRAKIDSKFTLRRRIAVRLVLLTLLVVCGIVGMNWCYLSEEFYERTLNEKNFQNAMWIDRNKYISRGCIYSFLHSYTELKQVPPVGYNKKEAKKRLESYGYSNIAEDKKVNVIGIMLESYNDFSKFDELEFVQNPYDRFHEIQNESVSGELVTSIFGGGTINTERKFLSGAANVTNFREKTNSYVRYFKEQGYTTEGSHPADNWFYSRNLVNENLGFDRYYFNENRYNSLYEYYHAPDGLLLSDIVFLYKEHLKNNDNPYFSFSVTYQNHLPYCSTSLDGGEYVANDERFTEEEYYILNNYLDGINDTGIKLYDMVQSLKYDEEPAIVILFGDHNPSLGSVYDKLGIDFDVSTEVGFNNYYCTPYVIWANESAKIVLDNDFVGAGEKISPNFLMNVFFGLAGYEGNEFMKASNELKECVSVISGDVYYEDGTFSRVLSEENEEKLNEYLKLEYYWMNEFVDR